ncbi:MAG: hypothetical protein JJE08_03480 [Proteiniphilum sp.]|nr:hypothetical protein [Proteiniphilum sp.]
MKAILILFFLSIAFCDINAQENAEKKEKSYSPEAIALYDQATDLMIQSKHDSALLLYDRAIEADPAYHIPYIGKANVLLQVKEFHKAMDAIETAVEKEPEFVESWQSAGIIADLIGDTQKANEYYKESIRLFNKNISETDDPDVIQGNRFGKIVSLTMLEEDEELEKEIKLFKEENSEVSNLEDLQGMTRENILQKIKTEINF